MTSLAHFINHHHLPPSHYNLHEGWQPGARHYTWSHSQPDLSQPWLNVLIITFGRDRDFSMIVTNVYELQKGFYFELQFSSLRTFISLNLIFCFPWGHLEFNWNVQICTRGMNVQIYMYPWFDWVQMSFLCLLYLNVGPQSHAVSVFVRSSLI